MQKGQRSKKGPPYAKAVIIILLISVIFGILFDLVCTQIEYKIYPKEYGELVTKYAEEYGVPEHIIYAVIKTESGFDSSTVSAAGAVGLMQLMPETFLDIANNFLSEDAADERLLYDPETNIRYGVFYLSWLYDKFENWDTVFAAYNGGIGNVNEWLSDPEYSDDGITLKSIPKNSNGSYETRNYVKKVNKALKKYDELYSDG